MFLQGSRSTSTSRSADTSSQSPLRSHHLSHTQVVELKEYHAPLQRKTLQPPTGARTGDAPQELQITCTDLPQPHPGKGGSAQNPPLLLPVTHLQTPHVLPEIFPHT